MRRRRSATAHVASHATRCVRSNVQYSLHVSASFVNLPGRNRSSNRPPAGVGFDSARSIAATNPSVAHAASRARETSVGDAFEDVDAATRRAASLPSTPTPTTTTCSPSATRARTSAARVSM